MCHNMVKGNVILFQHPIALQNEGESTAGRFT